MVAAHDLSQTVRMQEEVLAGSDLWIGGHMKKLLGLVVFFTLAGSLAPAAIAVDTADKVCTIQYNQCLASFTAREEKVEGIKSNDYIWNS
jgi:hypothetical protein